MLAIGALAMRGMRRNGGGLPDSSVLLRAGAVGMLGYWFASYTDFLGLEYISAQLERLVLFTYPAFVVTLRRHVFRAADAGAGARRDRRQLCRAGADLHNQSRHARHGSVAGVGLVLSAAIAFALYQLLAKQSIGRIGPRLFTCVAMSAAAIPVLIQFALTQPLGSMIVGPKLFAYGLLLAIGATVLPSFLLNIALQRISAQANSTIGTVSPVITIVLAVLLLGEPFTGTDLIGAMLVLAGVGWFTLADRKS